MKQFKFADDGRGPVDIPALGLTEVSDGDLIEVENPDVSAGLEGQDIWEHIPDPKRSKAAKKAAATRADDSTDEKG